MLVRPSYVLGGRAMEIVQNATDLVRFLALAQAEAQGKPVLIDKYLEGKEVEVDAICDGEDALIPGIMEHIERAGVHSGDSMAVYPAQGMTNEEVDTIVDYTRRMAVALKTKGLMNVQYVIMRADGKSNVYVLEVNPRASRTVPFISKVTGVPMVRLAVNCSLGKTLKEQGYAGGLWPRSPLVAVKAPVFSMSKLIGVDTYLGPEMKSTGEVMGVDRNLPAALAKALIAADLALKPNSGALLSLSDRSKAESPAIIRRLHQAGCTLYATARHGRDHPRPRHPGEPGRQAADRRAPQRARRDQRRPRALRDQHAGGRPADDAAGRLPHPPRRRRAPHPLLHLHRHRPRRHRGAAGRHARRSTSCRSTSTATRAVACASARQARDLRGAGRDASARWSTSRRASKSARCGPDADGIGLAMRLWTTGRKYELVAKSNGDATTLATGDVIPALTFAREMLVGAASECELELWLDAGPEPHGGQ